MRFSTHINQPVPLSREALSPWPHRLSLLGCVALILVIGIATTVNAQPPSFDLSVTLTGSPDPVREGQQAHFIATVSNSGPDPAPGVTLYLNSTYSTVSALNCFVPAGGPISCNAGDLPPGGSASFAIDQIAPMYPMPMGLWANATAVLGVDSDPGNDTSYLTLSTAPPPSITVTSPAFGATWSPGSTQMIRFNYDLPSAGQFVVVEVERTAFIGAWEGIGLLPLAGTSGVAEMPWTVTGPEAPSARVRVSWYSSPPQTATGTSGVFTIGAHLIDPVVNTTDDSSDGVCDGSHCSLREAIEVANAQGAPLTHISFNIPGGGPYRIVLNSPLPVIHVPVDINGSTQPGYSYPPGSSNSIEIDASAIPGAPGILTLSTGADTSFIWSLTLTGNANGAGIFAENVRNGLFYNNYIGVSPTSETRGNAAGIVVTNGGTAFQIAGNVIGGNSGAGIWFEGSQGSLFSNTIGADLGGSVPLGNGAGIVISGEGNRIGGSGGNTIAHNLGEGVRIDAGNNNEIVGNRIFENNGLGIDLGGIGGGLAGQVDPNDLGDFDPGPNDLLNHPVLLTMTADGSSTTVTGTLSTTGGSAPYRIDFYSSPGCNASGYGEGKESLGSLTVVTDSSGFAAFTTNLQPLLAGNHVAAATATTMASSFPEVRNTSEFSNCVAPEVTITINDQPAIPEGDSGTTNATFTVSLSAPPVSFVSVDYATAPDTAQQGVDFDAVSGVLTFLPGGPQSQTIFVPIHGNTAPDPDRSFLVMLTNVTGATPGAAQGIGTILDDDQVFSPPTGALSGGASSCGVAATLMSVALTGSAPWTITWSDGFVQAGVNASPAIRTVAPLSTTTYTLTSLTDAHAAGTTSGSATVTVTPLPIVTASNSGSTCAWSPVQLTASTIPGATYGWTGPGGFASGSQNPIAPAVPGIYTVRATVGACMSTPSATAVTTTEGCSNISFGPVDRIADVGADTLGATLGDVNGDGQLDLITTRNNANVLQVSLGNGHGGFGPPVASVTVASQPYHVAIADIDGDGHMDLVSANYNDGAAATIVYGDGTGQFSGRQDLPGDRATTLAVADFNEDGRADIVVTGPFGGHVFLNISSSTGAQAFSSTFFGGYDAVSVADLNADGHEDIVFGGAIQGLQVYLGDGHGAFTDHGAFAGGVNQYIYYVPLADLNGDGFLDAVLNANLRGAISVMYGTGDGGFSASVPYTVGSSPIQPQLADFDGDGRLDIAVSNYNDSSVSILYGSATGFDPALTIPTGATTWGLAAADLNHDGRVDLVASSGRILLNTGSRTFAATPTYPTGPYPYGILTGDFNEDGRPDILTADALGNSFSVSLANPSGGYFAPVAYPVGTDPYHPTIADLNRDGHLDVIVPAIVGGTTTIYFGDGSGQFTLSQSISGGGAVEAAVVDIDRDGWPDLLVANYGGGVSVLANDGTGHFAQTDTLLPGALAYRISTADMNGDGIVDLVVPTLSSTVEILLGDGAGHFAPPLSSPTIGAPYAGAIGDFNGDGKLDVATSNFNGNSIQILHGNGDGTLQPPDPADSYVIGPETFDIAPGDFNADGITDLVVSSLGSTMVSVLRGNGHGFDAPTTFTVGNGPAGVKVTDLDGDGRPDIVVANQYSSSFSVLHNTNCKASVLSFLTEPAAACGSTGAPFSTQPVLRIADDGGNTLTCSASGSVTASLDPASGTAGAALLGSTSAAVGSGVAAFTDLAIDQAGAGYRLNFSHPSGATAQSQPLTQGLITSIGGPAAACQSQGIYDGGPGRSSYSWTVDGLPAGGGRYLDATAYTGAHTLGLLAAGQGCSATASLLINLAPVLTSVNIAPSGPTTVCTACSAGVFTATEAGGGATTQQWGYRTTSGGPITPISGATGPSYTLSGTDFITPRDYLLVVTSTPACGAASVSNEVAVRVYQEPTATVSGGGAICDSGSAAVSAALTGAAPWAVTWSDGLVQTGVNSTSLVRSVTPNATTTYTVSALSDANGPGRSSGLATVTVTATPMAPLASSSGPSCTWSPVQLNASTVPGATYLWSGPGGFSSTLQNPLASAQGVYSVRAVIGACSSPPASVDIAITGVCAKPSFAPAERVASHSTFPAGGFDPTGVARGDLNGDGKLDLVVADRTGETVSFILGDGHGGFAAPQIFVTSSGAYNLAIGDFDGDGKTDVATANYGQDGHRTHDMTILYGDGQGGVLRRADVPVGPFPYAIAAGDFDGDGRTDLAVTDFSGIVHVFRQDAAGALTPLHDYAGAGWLSLVAADVDGDGDLDLVAATDTVQVLLNDGSGNFTFASSPSVSGRFYGAVVTDLNGDSVPDIALADYGSGDTAAVLYGNGDGTFGPEVRIPLGGTPYNISVADFDGDGHQDLVVSRLSSSGASDSVVIVPGTSGGFAAPQPIITPAEALVTGDFDLDGYPELILTRPGSGGALVEVIKDINRGTGSTPQIPANGPQGTAAGDFNGDGHVDLVVANFAGQTVDLLSGDGTGSLQPVSSTPMPGFPLYPAAGDFNGDGRMDAAVVVYQGGTSPGSVALFLGSPAGFQPSPAFYPAGSGASTPVVLDFNRDGKLDLAVAGFNSVQLFTGDGAGTLTAGATLAVGGQSGGIAAGDVSGDGWPDLVVSRDGGAVVVFLNDGAGGYLGPIVSSTGGSFPHSIALADMNADGFLDVVTPDSNLNTLTVLTGDGAGHFTAGPAQTVGSQPLDAAVADVNGDGRPDVVVTAYGGDTAQVFLGDGASGLTPSTTYRTGAGSIHTTVADFNADGRPDLAVSNYTANTVSILINTNCAPRSLLLLHEAGSCGTPGLSFAIQPSLSILDDGGNLLTCSAGSVTATLNPATGTAGALLSGANPVPFSNGVATFADLAIDQPGAGFKLDFTHTSGAVAHGRSFSQGVAAVIVGPTTITTTDTPTYDGGPGFSSYSWSLDAGAPIHGRYLNPTALSAGDHTLALTVSADGCASSTSITIHVSEPTADLAVTVSDGQTNAIPGLPITYTVVVSNAGPGSVTGATVTDSLPAALGGMTWTCVAAGGGACGASGSGFIHDSVNLPSGASATYTVHAFLPAGATGTLVYSAMSTTPAVTNDPSPGNNSVTDTDTIMPVADLAITKTDGLVTAIPGQPVGYTLVVSNSGPSNAVGATVMDLLPPVLAGATWTCSAGPGASCPASGSGNVTALVNLPVGSSASFTVAATISLSATGTLSNTATVAAPVGSADPNPANNSATDLTALSASPVVAVTSPNTAVSWRIATVQNITWTQNLGSGQNVLIEVSRNGLAGPWETIGTAPASSGSYPWTVTGPATVGALSRIRVSWTQNAAVNDASDVNFTVLERINVTAPNTAVGWRVANTQNITFGHNIGTGQQVLIELNRNWPGGAWETIGTPTTTNASTGTFAWTLTGPPTTGATARIRLTSVSTPSITDTSDVSFTIFDRINVTSPNTNLNWGVTGTQPITWGHNVGNGTLVNIDLTRDDGATWESIAAGVPNNTASTGVYNWTVTGPISTLARIRVTAVANPAWTDVSDTTFTIGNPLVTVTAPMGGSVRIGNTQNITFTHNLGVGQPFNIELTRDNGSTWTSLGNFTSISATSGSVPWLVNGPPTLDVNGNPLAAGRVRVTWNTDPAITDQSNTSFSILDRITVTAPNTVVSWRLGTAQTINWGHNYPSGEPMDVALSRDGGITWAAIATAVPSATATTGTLTWTVAGAPTAQARIRVSRTVDPSMFDVSDVNFTIADPTVTLTSPNTAVNWRVGDTQNISWTHNLGTSESVNIEVSRDGGATWSALAGNVPNTTATTGTYAWTVTGPPTLNPSLNPAASARVRVSWAADSSVTDDSNVSFTVSSRVTVTAPNTAVTWSTGTARTLTWTHNLGASSSVNIDLSRDGGSSWESVATGVPNATATTGAYNWTVGPPATTQARLRVTSTADPSAADPSLNDRGDVSFTIQNATVTLTAPNTAVNWRVGDVQNVTWTHNLGVGAPINLELSVDGGSTWAPIVANVLTTGATSGNYAWTVTGPPTVNAALNPAASARVRASWATDPAVRDDSNTSFTILSRVSVTAPNTAVSWTAGTTHAVTWNHNLGTGSAVNIDLSRDGGVTWESVAAGVPNSSATAGTFNWVVSPGATTQARLRVSSATDPGALDASLNDRSDVNFTIVNPTLTVTAPNTAVSWVQGSAHNITWSHNLGTAESVTIELTGNYGTTGAGALWTTIATVANTAATTGTYAWTVPATPGSQCRIRITWAGNSPVSDVSNVNFTIP